MDSKLLADAYELAIAAHAGQRRRGSDEPYVTHPLAVTARLRLEGFDDEVLAAALLHDAVEDTDVTLGEIVEHFGAGVGELVAALTEDPSIDDWGERKRALREHVAEAGPAALAIYAADKLSNLWDTRVLYAKEGEDAGERFQVPLDARIDAWRKDLEMVSRADVPPGLVRDARAELDALERERAEGLGAVHISG